jgi:hypothetical protein
VSHGLLDTNLEQASGSHGLEHLLLTERTAESVVLWIFAPDSQFMRNRRRIRTSPIGSLFENLDGGDFRAELPVDEDGIVLDYPDLFRRVYVVHQ